MCVRVYIHVYRMYFLPSFPFGSTLRSIALTSTLGLCGPLIGEAVWCSSPCSLISEGLPLIM